MENSTGRMLSFQHMVLVIAAFASPAIGSFVCCAVDRDDKPGEIIAPRSKCRSCSAALAPLDLIPVLSFVWLQAKCRSCGAPIPKRLFWTETLAAAAAILAVTFLGTERALCGLVLSWLLLTLALFDLEYGRLPTPLNGLLAACGLLFASMGAFSVTSVDSVAGGILGLLLSLGIAETYRFVGGREGLGRGDVKMFGAVGTWIGWQGLPWLFLLSSICAIVGTMIFARNEKSNEIVFGPFIGFGSFAIWFWNAA